MRGFTPLVELLAAIAVTAISILHSGAAPDPATTNTPTLHTRTFKLDSNGLYFNLQSMDWRQSETTTNFGTVDDEQKRGLRFIPAIDTEYEIRIAAGNFLKALGVNLAPPKGFAFHDREGLLTVRATDEDLELVEQAIKAMDVAPPQVTVKVRAIEISDEDLFRPEFEWFFKMIANARGKSPPDVAGIVTEPLFKTLLKRLEQRQGADLISETEVTTLSGRQAQVDLWLDGEPTNNSSAVSPSAYFPGVHLNTNSATALDVVPYVMGDGYTIQLTLIPTVTLSLGNNAQTNSVVTRNGGIPITGRLPAPRSRVRQVVASCIVWDGQTVVLPLDSFYAHGKNKVVVFVTPAIIDSSGNRKNPDESLLFAEKAVPDQTSIKLHP